MLNHGFNGAFRKALLTVIAVSLASSTLCADITIVRNLKLKSDSGAGLLIHARCATQVQGRAARRETEVLTQGPLAQNFHYPARTITWVSLDKNTVHQLDPTQTDFQKVALSRWAGYLAKRHASVQPSGIQISQTWSRIIPEEEVREVRGQICKKFTFEWRFEVENPDTYAKKQYGVRTTLWLTQLPAPLVKTLNEEKSFQADYHKRLGGRALEDLNAVTMQYAADLIGIDKETLFAAVSQGTARLQRISGYPMASQTQWFQVGYKKNKPLFTVTSELETLSLKRLAETVFVPSMKNLSYDEMDINAQLIAKNQ